MKIERIATLSEFGDGRFTLNTACGGTCLIVPVKQGRPLIEKKIRKRLFSLGVGDKFFLTVTTVGLKVTYGSEPRTSASLVASGDNIEPEIGTESIGHTKLEVLEPQWRLVEIPKPEILFVDEVDISYHTKKYFKADNSRFSMDDNIRKVMLSSYWMAGEKTCHEAGPGYRLRLNLDKRQQRKSCASTTQPDFESMSTTQRRRGSPTETKPQLTLSCGFSLVYSSGGP